MPRVDIVVETKLNRTSRIKQLEAMFDVPAQEASRLSWQGEFPYDDQPWNVGLIVGPSGCGKSTIARKMFGEHQDFRWTHDSVIDDFKEGVSIADISSICQSVGFNTIPAWMRPYQVLSNGERFRVDLARRLLELSDPILCDEFTSVVDRQVAQIGSHAVQKYIRRNNRKFVAVSCHYDIIEWLQPDWIFEPNTMTFTRRLLQRRPAIQAVISRVSYAAWKLFAPYHYLTAELNRGARCFVLFVNGVPASFIGVISFPHPQVRDIVRVSRNVTLPDWQGLGLAMILSEKIGAAYKAIGKRLRHYPAHFSFIRSFDNSKNWVMTKRPGTFPSCDKQTTTLKKAQSKQRPCAVFEYAGPKMDDRAEALRLLG